MEDDTIMTNFRMEGTPAFPATEEEGGASAASSAAGTTNTEQTQSQGGEQGTAQDAGNTQNADGTKQQLDDAGLLEHPRWKERETDWTGRFNEQEQRHVQELQKLREEFDAKFTQGATAQTAAQGQAGQIPEWFGGDEAQWGQFNGFFQNALQETAKSARAEALKELETKTQAEQKAITDATDYMNTEITAIESDKTLNPKGEKIDRNKIFKVAKDFDCVDSKGRWNWKAAFPIYKQQFTSASTGATDARREIASATQSDNRGGGGNGSKVTSSEDFKKPDARPW